MAKKAIYTRNNPTIEKGANLPSIVIYNYKEEEMDLSMVKTNKLYITVPTLSNQSFMNEIMKLDILFQDYTNCSYYLISNESVFTQSKHTKSKKFYSFQILSDFKNRNFARYTGTYIYELGALVKSIFIVNNKNEVQYIKYYDDLYSNFDANEIMKELNTL